MVKPVPVYLETSRNPYFVGATPHFFLWSTENRGEIAVEALGDSSTTFPSLPGDLGLPEKVLSWTTFTEETQFFISCSGGICTFKVPHCDLDDISELLQAVEVAYPTAPQEHDPSTQQLDVRSHQCIVTVQGYGLTVSIPSVGSYEELTLPGSAFAVSAAVTPSGTDLAVVASTDRGIYEVMFEVASFFDSNSQGPSDKSDLSSPDTEPRPSTTASPEVRVIDSSPKPPTQKQQPPKEPKKSTPPPQRKPSGNPKRKGPDQSAQTADIIAGLERRVAALESQVSQLKHLNSPRDISSAVQLVMAGERPLAWFEDHRHDLDEYLRGASASTAQLVSLVLIDAFPGSQLSVHLRETLEAPAVDTRIYDRLK